MTATYTLSATTTFSAAHRLRGYEGRCSRVHGHNYRIRIEVAATKLNEIGLAVDYYDIKQALYAEVEKLDHYYVNELPPFDKINPSAENMAAWFYRQLTTTLNNETARVTAVTLWESDNFSVHYTESTP